jgi:chromosomal replication initiation ATPase DnaA
MATTPQQLTFDIPHRPALGLEDFLVSQSNEAAVALVDRWPDWAAGAAVISGPAGSGKSHLGNVWRLRSNARVLAATALTEPGVPVFSAAPALVIEDIDRGIGSEQALFHLLNLVREQRLAILLTTSIDPGDIPIRLPDLRSRLRALALARIAPPDDALLRAVLVKMFADRQLTVDPAIIGYALVRMERSTESARRLVAEVDRLALAMHRGVTRAVVSAALDLMGAPGKGT